MEIQWALVLFTVISGAGAGLALFDCLFAVAGVKNDRRRLVAVVALALLVVGGCCSVLHLAQPANIMAAAQNLFSFSGISVEMIFLALSCLFVLIYAIVAKGEASAAAERIIAILAIAACAVLCFAVGNGYVIAARESWNTLLLPLAYFGSNVAVGAALFALLAGARVPEDDQRRMKLVVLVAVVAGAVLTCLYALAPQAIDHAGAWVALFAAASAAGIAFAVAYWKTNDRWMAFAIAVLACLVVAAFALRIAMWVGGVPIMNAFGATWGVVNV